MFSSLSYADQESWRLQEKLGLPDWLKITFEHRTRYEVLDDQFRSMVNGKPGNGGDQAILFRNLIHGVLDFESIRFGAEFIDSRITLADSGTASNNNQLTTNIANPFDLLQAYIELPMDNWLLDDSKSLFRLGRITIDAGSRRLIARNRFRNTISAFTGAEWKWARHGYQLQTFYVLPVRRVVDGEILDNEPKFDQEYKEIRFWGAFYEQPLFSPQDKIEAFVLGLNENNAWDWQTRGRDLYTFGLRLFRKPQKNEFDYEIETAYQLGESKASPAAMRSLEHWAHFHHAELGYSFDTVWFPRLIFQYDYASGDDDPNDNENNRFDTLYGARRFDFGPTSIFGAFARANINSPGIRLNLKPHSALDTMMALRGFWRATTKDSWTSAGINGSSPFIGTLVEMRVRWEILPKNIMVEGGVAHIFAGDLMDEAGKDDSTYGYVQTTLSF